MLGERVRKFGGDTCIGLEDIARKREGGLEIAPPPSGARVNVLTGGGGGQSSRISPTQQIFSLRHQCTRNRFENSQ